MKETVLQFGTGNFLRGFADCFIDALNKKGLYDGRVVVVSPTDSKTVAKINACGGRYNLVVRGVENGKSVCRINEINAITRAINPYSDFEEFLSLAGNPELRFIVSNTTEAGIRYDLLCKFSDKPAASFPAKLTQFLYRRYKNGLSGFVILACELIDGNGAKLKKCVLKYAEEWGLEKAFSEWINRENSFCSTLVDRIVTGFPSEDEAQKLFDEIGYSDERLDTAEPYHLWAIEGDFEDELPLKKAGFNVIWTDDVSPYKKMKVRILNGSHTSLVFPSLLCGVETVKESLDDSLLNEFLKTCLFGYIMPCLNGGSESERFADAVLERFANPYIRHKWKSISLNSVSKFTARVLPTVSDCEKVNGALPKPLVFSLACLIEYYKSKDVCDDKSAVDFIKNADISEILENRALWGRDLSKMTALVNESLNRIYADGIREAIKWSMS